MLALVNYLLGLTFEKKELYQILYLKALLLFFIIVSSIVVFTLFLQIPEATAIRCFRQHYLRYNIRQLQKTAHM